MQWSGQVIIVNSYYVGSGKLTRVINLLTESVFDFIQPILADDDTVLGYEVKQELTMYSTRYKKWITVKAGVKSDGATNAFDIDSFCWIFHDQLCNTGMFNDYSACNNLQASSILSDILQDEGRYFRRFTWFVATWIGGGGKARDNGMF